VRRLNGSLLAISGALLWLLVWGFAAGWAGEIRYFPDTDNGLGEWLPFALFYYAGPVITLWGLWSLIRPSTRTTADD
jgi:hypothetical protein